MLKVVYKEHTGLQKVEFSELNEGECFIEAEDLGDFDRKAAIILQKNEWVKPYNAVFCDGSGGKTCQQNAEVYRLHAELHVKLA